MLVQTVHHVCHRQILRSESREGSGSAPNAPRNQVAEAWGGRVMPAGSGFSRQVTYIDAPARTVR